MHILSKFAKNRYNDTKFAKNRYNDTKFAKNRYNYTKLQQNTTSAKHYIHIKWMGKAFSLLFFSAKNLTSSLFICTNKSMNKWPRLHLQNDEFWKILTTIKKHFNSSCEAGKKISISWNKSFSTRQFDVISLLIHALNLLKQPPRRSF